MTKRATRRPKASPLQRSLAAQVVELVRAQNLLEGEVLTEVGLAQHFGVSRSPVRAALGLLARESLIAMLDGSWRLLKDAKSFQALPLDVPVAHSELLFIAIARDRIIGHLPGDTTEADLMRRYKATRPTVLQVLTRLLEVGQVERKAGQGWTFVPPSFDAETRRESYRFRLLVEPAALVEPGYRLDAAWAASMRARHEAVLAEPWRDTAAVALYDLNAEFHEGLAVASGNRFYSMAVAQQNRVRRFVNVHWRFGPQRVAVSCYEHLEILSRLEAGAHEVASALMRAHLLGAAALPFVSTTAPAAAPAPRAAAVKSRRGSPKT